MNKACRKISNAFLTAGPDSSEDGVSILAAIMALLILSALGIAIISIVNMEKMIGINIFNTTQCLYTAEAGIDRAIRSVMDDAAAVQTGNPSHNGYYGSPAIDATRALSKGTGRVKNKNNALIYGNGYCRLISSQKMFCRFSHDTAAVTVSDFQQAINLAGSRISRVEIGCRFRRKRGRGRLLIEYETGSGSGSTHAYWDSRKWRTSYLDITGDRVWTWDSIIDPAFKITATADVSCSRRRGRVTYDVDYLFLKVTCSIDASTEPWYSSWRMQDDKGTPRTVNMSLDGGRISRMPVYDEAGKVNINYARKPFMRYLFKECGIAGGDANAIASEIVSIRSTTLFDRIEGLKSLNRMTDDYYRMIRDYVTVYSWANGHARRPSGSRPPVNINTAPGMVLRALFDPLGLDTGDPARLTSDIITRRNSSPFTCMYTSNPDITDDFAGFIDSRSYLSSSEKKRIKENCDASSTKWNGSNLVSAELCYCSTCFSVVSTGTFQNSSRSVKRVFENHDVDNDGIFNIHAHKTLNYWKEITD